MHGPGTPKRPVREQALPTTTRSSHTQQPPTQPAANNTHVGQVDLHPRRRQQGVQEPLPRAIKKRAGLQDGQVQVAQHAAADGGWVAAQHRLVGALLGRGSRVASCGTTGWHWQRMLGATTAGTAEQSSSGAAPAAHKRACMLKCSLRWLSMLSRSSCGWKASHAAWLSTGMMAWVWCMLPPRAKLAPVHNAFAAPPCLRQHVGFGIRLQVPHLLPVLRAGAER